MSEVSVQQNGFVSVVTLQRPEARNALSPALIQEVADTFHKLANDQKVRVIVLRGAGESFCTGADISYMKSMAKFSMTENQQDAEKLYALFASIADCPKPVVAMVQGHAMGGGVGLVAVCDYIITEKSTKFCFSEVKLGILPAVISSFVLKKIGYSQSVALMTTADTFSADTAKSIGLSHYVGTNEQNEAELKRVLNLYLAAATSAITATKKLLKTISAESDAAKIKSQSTRAIAEQRVSNDGQEGLNSFLEKRKPNWVVTQ